MNQAEMVQKLDTFFAVGAFDEREYWTQIIPADALAVYGHWAEPDFVQGPWNGLMLNNTSEIDRVYLIVFPVQQVLDTILALELERGASGAMVFAQHPADFEESGQGFLAISEDQLDALREQNISYYCCHAPLDCHPETSTAIAWAKALKLRDWEPFMPHFGGMEGVHGFVGEMSFGEFALQLSEVMDLPYIRYDQLRFNGLPVNHVSLIPGGGNDPRQLAAAQALGCDTYVTGHWWPVGHYEYAVQQRAKMREIVPGLPMNLIGTSHYASEMIVLRDKMLAWFRNAGIEARFVAQANPWR